MGVYVEQDPNTTTKNVELPSTLYGNNSKQRSKFLPYIVFDQAAILDGGYKSKPPSIVLFQTSAIYKNYTNNNIEIT